MLTVSNRYYFGYKTGASLYFVLTDPETGDVWNGSAFAGPNLADWSAYAQAMPETATGMGRYLITFPTAITARGRYSFSVRKEASPGTPAAPDPEVGGGELGWSGTSITSLESMPVFPNFDLTRTLQKILASTAGPASGAGSGHVVFNDPANTGAAFECDTDADGNRSNMNYH